MSCVQPDGKPTESGRKMLQAVKQGKETPEAIAEAAGLPLFRVRSGLRDMLKAGYVSSEEDKYKISPRGEVMV
jgi:DNA-binding IclR family transcriptional regulator